MEKKEILQAVIVADNFNDCFKPFTSFNSPSLLPIVNVPLISYSLETLNQNGVEEVWIVCSTFVDKVREFVKRGQDQSQTWSVGMIVQVIGCEVRCFGDAMRELDTKGMLRSDFILTSFDTITNAKLIPSIMKQHKENCKRDKETAMTVVYKKITPGQRSGNEILIATEKSTSRLLFYQRLHSTVKEQKFKFPINIFLNNHEVELHHDLMDPQISICSITTLPLFSDNFDYETRDHFIRGVVMGLEEYQIGSIYVAQLPNEQFAAKVSDWMCYHNISQDIINRWVYPLVPDMGVCTLRQQYLFLKNNIYRNSATKIGKNCNMINDVVLQSGCDIGDKSSLSNSVLGRNCKIGTNCIIKNAYIFNDTTIDDDCKLQNCIIGAHVEIEKGCTVQSGSVISNNCVIEMGSNLSGFIIQSSLPKDSTNLSEELERISEKAYRLIEDKKVNVADESEEDIESDLENYIKLQPQTPNYNSSAYSSGSENDEDENEMQVFLEDADQFFVEVVDSIKRGFNEKSNADFLILEINSSRYTYNIPFNEVNFLVVKASLSLPVVIESKDPLEGFKELYKYLGEKVLKNYIKDEEAMNDCLGAIVESCEEHDALKPYIVKILLLLYNEDVLSEDGILAWFKNCEQEWIKKSLKKFIEWLEQVSEESD